MRSVGIGPARKTFTEKVSDFSSRMAQMMRQPSVRTSTRP